MADDTRKTIVEMLKNGCTSKEISAATGFSMTTIDKIRQALPPEPKTYKTMPADLRVQWEELNRIGDEYRKKKGRK